MSKNLSFPKTLRLIRRKSFEKVQQNRARVFGRVILIEILPQSDSPLKMGITVSRKYGKAHERNRFKRCVREAFRLSYANLPRGYHIVVRPKRPKIYPTTSEIMNDLLKLLA
ncbi:MAG: ribonuclease P protein component [Chlamydiia bacterium]|nr:ribonuclease P protein component [Chlamydiia bacterium]